MFPLFPSVPNQIRAAQGGNDLASQQAILPNPNEMAPQLHAPNHQLQPQSMPDFNNQNPLSNFIGNNSALMNRAAFMPPNCYQNGVNMQLMLQNGFMAMQQPFLQSCIANQHAMNCNPMMVALMQGQLYNAPQNLTQVPGQQMQGQFTMHGVWPQNFHQNVNQGLFPSQNPMFPANNVMSQQCMPDQLKQCMQDHVGSAQAVGFSNNLMSPKPTAAGSFFNSSVLPVGATQEINLDQRRPIDKSMDHNARQESTAAAAASSQDAGLSNFHLSQLHDNQKNLQSGRFEQTQNSYAQNSGSNVSNVYLGNTSQNFPRQGFCKRGQSQARFQKLQSPRAVNGKGNLGPITESRGRGPQYGRERNPQFARFYQHAGGASQRPRSVNYTVQEIQQWREARKRNFPTTVKIERKLAGIDRKDEAIDRDFQMCRQQLKDVLAKQAELGVEIAELPPYYLSGPENENGEIDHDRKSHNMKGRFKNKYNKRGRRGNENRYNKRQKPWNYGNPVSVPMHRKPTLLQKLLSADIKRDKNKLLQVFRFMTLNSFFEGWPEKPLEFPLVSAKDAISKEGTAKGGMSGGCRDENCDISCSDDDDQVEEVRDQPNKSEEGEITD